MTSKSKGAVPIAWMQFWLLVSVINPLDLKFSPTLIALFVNLSTICALVGYVAGTKYKSGYVSSAQAIRRLKKITTRTYIVVSLPIITLCYISLNLLQNISIFKYRRIILSEPERLFGHPLVLPIFQLFIEGTLLLLMFASIFFFLQYKSKKLITIAVFISVLFSLIFLGRYHVYRIIVFSFICALVQLSSARLFKLLPYFIVLISIVIYGSILRSGGLFGIEEVLVKHVIGYHTFGYNLAETFLNEAPGLTERTWLGGATMATVFYFILKPFQFIFDFTTYLQSDDYYNQDIFRYMGTVLYSNKQLDINVNAFYTLFADVWRDFGWLGILFFYPLGFIAGSSYKGLLNKNFNQAIVYYIVAYVFVFAQMKNPFVRHEMLIPLLFILITYFKRKKST